MSSTSDAGKTSPEPEVSPPANNSKNSVRRWNMGTTMTIQVIAMAVLLVAINIVTFNFGSQIDLTRQANAALSKETLNNLGSAEIQDRQQAVKIIAVLNPYQFRLLNHGSQENIVERIKIKLQEYVDKSNGKIEVEFVNAIVEHGRLQELSVQYGVKFTTSMLIVDGRPVNEASEETIQSLKKAYPDLSETKIAEEYKRQLLSRHVRYIPASELYFSEVDYNYIDSNDNPRHYVSLWKDEAEITTNVMGAVEGKQKKIYFLYDKCRLDSKRGGKAPWEFLRDSLRGQNIQLEKISLANLPISNVNGRPIKKIPADADGIALISPQVDFTDEELLSLSEYWEVRDGASMLITLDPEVRLPKLNSFLLRSRIKPNNDRIIRKEGDQIMVNAEVEFLQGPEVNGDLSGKSTTFGGASQSIELRPDNNNKLIEPFALIKVNPNWWGETEFGKGNPTYDHKSDSPTPLNLAVAVTRGQLNDQKSKPLVSKLVVIGNSDFLDKNAIRDEQEQYLNQIGAWLVGREPLMEIPQSSNFRRKVFIAAAHRDLLNNLFLFFIPCAALIITGFVWNFRRS